MGAEYIRERLKHEFQVSFKKSFFRELCELRGLARHGYLPLEQISKLLLRALNEIAQRFAVTDEGDLVDGHFLLTGRPEKIHDKFLTISRQVPADQVYRIDPIQLVKPVYEIISTSKAPLIAIAFHGSYFEPWKTPSSASDLDLILVFGNLNRENWEQAKERTEGVFNCFSPGLELDIRTVEINHFFQTISDGDRHAAQIAVPFRSTTNLGVSRSTQICGNGGQEASRLSDLMKGTYYRYPDLPVDSLEPPLDFWDSRIQITPDKIASYISEPGFLDIGYYFGL